MTDRQYGRHSKKIYEWDEVEDEASSHAGDSSKGRSVEDAMVVDDTAAASTKAQGKNPLSKMFKRKLF